MELKFQPDGTKVSTLRNRLKLLVRVRIHTDERSRSCVSISAANSSRKTAGKHHTSRKNWEKWWQQHFLLHKKKCCHHPAERPVHSGFSSKGGSSGSTFAKL
nr:hypothetical protein [Phocaeicola sartorii]